MDRSVRDIYKWILSRDPLFDCVKKEQRADEAKRYFLPTLGIPYGQKHKNNISIHAGSKD